MIDANQTGGEKKVCISDQFTIYVMVFFFNKQPTYQIIYKKGRALPSNTPTTKSDILVV